MYFLTILILFGIAEFAYAGSCPSSNPYVYFNGKYCCKHKREKIYRPQGTKCDGSKIGFYSLCCYNDAMVRCRYTSCKNYNRGISGASGASLIPNSIGCWTKCGKRGGHCPSICGVKGFCCRRGYKDCTEDIANANPYPRHACIRVSNAPTGVSLIPNTRGCWLKCGFRGGKCPSVCGKKGFCCRIGYKDCPANIASFNPYPQHACIRAPNADFKTVCEDRWNKGCSRLKSRGYCKRDNFKARMKYWCGKTCGYCSDGSPPVPPVPKATCGRGGTGDKQTFIVHGVNAAPGAWPWMASLQSNYRHVCGGTLLTPKWVLTAAHCVGGINRNNLRRWTIKLGAHDHRRTESSVQRVYIRRVIKHPKWRKRGLIADLTLLELATPVTLNRRVNIACLPKKGVYPPLGKSCVLTGWGTVTHPGRPYHTLQQVRLPVVARRNCLNHVEDICVGKGFRPQPDGKQQPNACRGDSGGPLVCIRSDGLYQLDGVASFVYTYCKYYTAYAPVNKYLDWVNSYIRR